jgi:hypothetical protein
MGETGMKRFLLTAVLVLGVIAPISKSNANSLPNAEEIKLTQKINDTTKTGSTWQEFSPDEFNFSVLFPTQANPSITKSEDETFLLNLRVAILKETGYLLGYGKFKVDISQNKSGNILDLFISGRVDKNAKLVSKQNIQLEGYPGKEYQVRYDNGVISKGRVYLVGQNIYILEVINPQTQDSQDFFNSFKLLK